MIIQQGPSKQYRQLVYVLRSMHVMIPLLVLLFSRIEAFRGVQPDGRLYAGK